MSPEGAGEGPASVRTQQVVWGWFPGNAALQLAIETLGAHHYDPADFTLPNEQSWDEGAGARPGMTADGPETPGRDEDSRILATSMAGVTAALAAGAVIIATGGAAALALGAAAAAAVGAGALAEWVGIADYRAHADRYDADAASGRLVLAVHATTPAHADHVSTVMRESGATATRLTRHPDNAAQGGVYASTWTGER